MKMTNPAVPEIHVYVSNINCAYSCGCRLDLRRIATEGRNVEYPVASGWCLLRLRRPAAQSKIYPSGKITCSGAWTEREAYVAARRTCRQLQKIFGKQVRLCNFRITTIFATTTFPFQLNLNKSYIAF